MNIIYKAKITSNLRNYHEKYTAEPAKVYLNSDMETITNHPITKNKGQIPNFRKYNGNLKNSKHYLKYNFIFKKMQTNKKNWYLLFFSVIS